MTHSYFLDTVESIRSTSSCVCDMVLLILIACFLFGGFAALQEKGRIDNYHERWMDGDPNL